MQILLTNDDGIYAPGWRRWSARCGGWAMCDVVAPAVEQSGVGHSITFLSPLMAKEVFDGDRRRGWAVEGSPADCVKLALAEFCPKPDLLVSGINGGLNLGINVLYSGTVAGATEGAVFGLTSFAVSLEYDEHAKFDRGGRDGRAADRADPGATRRGCSPAVQYQYPDRGARAADGSSRRADGDGRLAGRVRSARRSEGPALLLGDGHAGGAGRRRTDRSEAWEKGYVTLTPLRIDRTEREMLERMRDWKLVGEGMKNERMSRRQISKPDCHPEGGSATEGSTEYSS